jgi:hypothetical protein
MPPDGELVAVPSGRFSIVLNERFPEAASLQFNRMLAESETVIMVVLGDSAEADLVCRLAAPTCSNRGPLKRRLVRARVLLHTPVIARRHSALRSVMRRGSGILAFCLTVDREVRGIIRTGMSVSMGTVLRSFEAATEHWETPAPRMKDFPRH